MEFNSNIFVTIILSSLLNLLNGDNDPDIYGNQRNYLILASTVLRPNSIYKIVVNTRDMERCLITASISRNGVQVTSAQLETPSSLATISVPTTSSLDVMMMKVPMISPGEFKLKVEGVDKIGGGVLWSDTRVLEMSTRFVAILIQINRAVFNVDQKIRFRVIILSSDMKMYSDAFDINILNPKGYVMKNYGSVYLNVGVGSYEYQIPRDANRGWWTIQVVVKEQIQEKRILVEKYYLQRTEVFVKSPETIYDIDGVIPVTVYGWYLNNAPVLGNGTLSIYVTSPDVHYKQRETVLVRQQEEEMFEGTLELEIDLAEIEAFLTPLAGAIVTTEFTLYDKRLELTTSGFSKTMILDGTVKLRFLGGRVKFFKSTMPFHLQVLATIGHHGRLPKIKSDRSDVGFTQTFVFIDGTKRTTSHDGYHMPEDGIFKLTLWIPENVVKVNVRVIYKDDDEMSSTEIEAFPYRSLDNRRLLVDASNEGAEVGSYLIVHVHGNFYMPSFCYVVISKGLVVHAGQEELVGQGTKPIHTFAIPVSLEMTPSCNLVVWHVTRDGLVVSDSKRIHVNPLTKKEFNFELNEFKDKTGNTVEFRVSALPGDEVAISGQDIDTSCINCGQELSVGSVLESFDEFDVDAKWRSNKITWRSIEPVFPDEVVYLNSENYGVDDGDTFVQSGIFALTNVIMLSSSGFCGNVSLPCQDGGCFPIEKLCDGIFDCKNGFDEANCTRWVDSESRIDWIDFRIFRYNHFDQYYDIADGDWAWKDLNTNGFDGFHVPVPNRGSSWMLNAIHVNKDRGLTMLPQFITFDGVKPFCISVELPSECVRGEQLGIRVELFNFGTAEMFVTVVLKSSSLYRFVHVESEGQVRSYDPRTSSGEHHHLVWVYPGTSLPVFVPIVAMEVGEMEINIEAWTNVGMDKVSTTINVRPEGVTQFLHTSLLLDLKNQPQVLKFLDVNLTETPVVPYERWRKYVFGSPIAEVSVIGDVFGPVFSDIPLTAESVLRKPDRTGEMQAFNLGVNLLTLNYLRLTNQLTPSLYNTAMDEINYFFAYTMAYQHPDGGFTMFKDNHPSVWLSAFVLRVLQLARFPDWENDIYIDSQITIDCLSWVLLYQTPEGSFTDTRPFPFDRKLHSATGHHYRYQNISLTAQVLLTLSDVTELPGELRIRAANAKLLATHYLERHLADLKDPYEIAIVAYALTKVNSVDKEAAFNLLDKIKIEQEEHVYWSKEVEEPVRIVLENQRPYVQPKLPGKYDAVNVETTAYALLVYVINEGFFQENIVRWLNAMRKTDAGFSSTQDTFVAMMALTEYTFRSRIRDVTTFSVNFELSSMSVSDLKIDVLPDSLIERQSFSVDNVWGFVGVNGRGSGFGLVQLDVQYGVDWPFLIIPPPVPAFELDVKLRYSGKNSSVITITSCQRWTLTSESPVSGLAVVEIQNPTGYWIYQHDLTAAVLNEKVPHAKRAKIGARTVTVYFDHLTPSWSCMSFKLTRYFPVANMTQYLKARVYEYYTPERYNESLIDAFNLYILSICHVCGSYQCPYCPFYSAATSFITSFHYHTFCILVSIFFTACYT